MTVEQELELTEDLEIDLTDIEDEEEEEKPVSPFQDMFPKSLMVATSTYAYHVFVYMQRRPELDLAETGLRAMPFFLNVRRVKEEHSSEYYQHLSGMVRTLLKYASLEESLSKSGAYAADRLAAVEMVRVQLTKFDNSDPRVFELLTSMLDV